MIDFSHLITYRDDSILEGTFDSYPVNIVSLSDNPGSVNLIDGLSASISGHYQDSFFIPNGVKYLDVSGDIITVDRLGDIDPELLDEMVSFIPSGEESKLFEYQATGNGNSMTYQITVYNDWDKGKDQLVELVEGTI